MPSFPQIGPSVKCLFLYVQIFIQLSASAIVQDMGHQIKTVKIKGFGILAKFLRRDDGFETLKTWILGRFLKWPSII